MQVQSLSQEHPLEEGMSTLSSILAWRILWTEEPGRLQFIGSHRVGHNWSNLAHTFHLLLFCSTFQEPHSQKTHACTLSFSVWSFWYLFATSWTVGHQASLSMGSSRQKYWSELSFPPPGNLPNPGIRLTSPALADGFPTTEPHGKPQRKHLMKTLYQLHTFLGLFLALGKVKWKK